MCVSEQIFLGREDKMIPKPFDSYADNVIADPFAFEKACMRSYVTGHHPRGVSVWI